MALKVGALCEVTQAGDWLSHPARIDKEHPDGTFDVRVYELHGVHSQPRTSHYVLKSKPYPSEVREPTDENKAREAMAKWERASVPVPDMWGEYEVEVIRREVPFDGMPTKKGVDVIRARVKINGKMFE